MKIYTIILSYLVFFLLNSQSLAAAQQRIALVIGNADYRIAPLKNPGNDAADMATALKRLGFKVDKHINAEKKQMKRALSQFGKKLSQPDTVGLFYYAGHGVQINNRNYLIPIGAEIED